MANISFIDLIEPIRAETILDVGCGGLGGENTTNFLVDKFGTSAIHGVCKDPNVAAYANARGLTIDIKKFNPDEYGVYDFVVYDPGIEDNLAWWKEPNIQNVGKYFATYIMTTDQYGDEHTPQQIRDTWKKVWGGFPTEERIREKNYAPLKLVNMVTETRRPEITWVLLSL